jgi:hypothetical protein
MSKEELNQRQIAALKEIATYTRGPTPHRYGYSKYWTAKTNQSLHEKGLVEFVYNSVVITDKGLEWLEEFNTRAGEQNE